MCPSTLRTHLSLFMSFMKPFSPLPAQQQEVSTLVYISICLSTLFFFLHDIFFTTTCTTTEGKYFLFCASFLPLYIYTHLTLFTSSMTHSSPLPAQQQKVSSLLLCMCPSTLYPHVFCLFILHNFLSLFISSMTPSSPLPVQPW